MSPKCLPEKQRREIIRDNILTHSYEKLAQLCSCSKRTIIRTINKWRLQGGYEDVLWDEFARSYPIVKEHDPGRAFDRLVFLLGKTFTHRVEAKTELVERKELDVTIIANYTAALESAADRDLQSLRAKKQVDSPRPNA